jgi:hypothetical protein
MFFSTFAVLHTGYHWFVGGKVWSESPVIVNPMYGTLIYKTLMSDCLLD